MAQKRALRSRSWLYLGGVLVAGLAVAIVLIRLPRGPRQEPWPAVRFVDVTESSGIRFVHYSGATPRKLLPETMGSGVAVLDFDRDGKPDLLFVNSCPWPGQVEAR